MTYDQHVLSQHEVAAAVTHPEWLALVRRRENAYVTGACTCCVMREPPEERQAAYRWTVRIVNGLPVEELLCVECCAHWRMFAAQDEMLLPLKVESLD